MSSKSLFWLVFTLPAITLAQQPAAAADREARVAWLKEHAIALRSIDPADEDFSDLEPLRKAIGEARIVQLGEQQHTDGATLMAKARLIKFLHQKMGFDVLAFESGLYDCRKAWELLKVEMDPFEAVRQGVFGIWTSTEQFQPVINYLGQQARGDRPLELCGFDCQFSGRGANGRIVEDIKHLLSRLDDGALDMQASDELIQGIASLSKYEAPPEPIVRERFSAAVKSLNKALSAQQPTAKLPANELAFWQQLTKCIDIETKRHWPSEGKEKGGDDNNVASGNLRDAQMANNLVWLAREAYPGRKIISWAASSHLIRNRHTLKRAAQEGPVDFPLFRPMGDGVWAELGKESYTLGFLSGEGVLSWGKVPPPAAGSLEDLFQVTGYQSAIVDFRRLDEKGNWLRQPIIARPMGYVNYTGDWTNAFDGFVFILSQYSSTPAQRLNQARAAARDQFALGWTGPKKGSGVFESGLDTEVKHGGNASAYIKATTDRPRGGTTLVQAFAADSFRGKRVRMSAYVRTRDVGSIALWMRVDTAESSNVAFDNMAARPIKGTNDWTKHEIVLDVPADAADITFGVIASGGGQAWFDDFQFEAVDSEVATTAMPAPIMKRKSKVGSNLSKGPRNLDFEG
jgi:erythromycin esterase